MRADFLIFFRVSPKSRQEYAQVMDRLRSQLAIGVSAWISLGKEREERAQGYREFEKLVLEIEVATRFNLEALRLLETHLEGEVQVQTLAYRLPAGLPFLAYLRVLVHKASAMKKS